MIKIVSFVLFISAFIWTWCLFNSPSQMGTDVHAGIQSKLTILIEDTVKAKRPSMTNFRLNKMYTEKIEDSKVKAHFSYQFDEEQATQTVSGEAILTKALSEDPNVQKWVLQSVKTGGDVVEFKEGVTITSDGKTETPAAETSTETTPAASAASESSQTAPGIGH
ncbi:hypothetical protein CIK05_14810 [Bdellovibrio sp. qaytius]|nr:hypothetical protein CIK05_14810 [Bdellovibrio sp. qaytius]